LSTVSLSTHFLSGQLSLIVVAFPVILFEFCQFIFEPCLDGKARIPFKERYNKTLDEKEETDYYLFSHFPSGALQDR